MKTNLLTLAAVGAGVVLLFAAGRKAGGTVMTGEQARMNGMEGWYAQSTGQAVGTDAAIRANWGVLNETIFKDTPDFWV